MKKYICLLLCLALIPVLSGCSDSGSTGIKKVNPSVSVNDILEQNTSEPATGNNNASGINSDTQSINDPGINSDAESNNDPEINSDAGNNNDPEINSDAGSNNGSYRNPGSDHIDVDLTTLSSTMVYAEVYNMMVSPEDYIGKIIKMGGQYACYYDEKNNIYFHACFIQDATACCAQGIEFVLTDDYAFPDDYPDADEDICVVGVFDTYEEDGYTYCTLRNAELL